MKHPTIKLCILLIITLFSCKLPDQPPLSEDEKLYFKALEKMYKCKVEREIQPVLLIEKEKNKKGVYTLGIEIECRLLNEDTLKVQSFKIADYPYKNVLNRNSIYDEIIISYSCKTGENQYRNKVFEYKIDSSANVCR